MITKLNTVVPAQEGSESGFGLGGLLLLGLVVAGGLYLLNQSNKNKEVQETEEAEAETA